MLIRGVKERDKLPTKCNKDVAALMASDVLSRSNFDLQVMLTHFSIKGEKALIWKDAAPDILTGVGDALHAVANKDPEELAKMRVLIGDAVPVAEEYE
jgi:hypothetical protein